MIWFQWSLAKTTAAKYFHFMEARPCAITHRLISVPLVHRVIYVDLVWVISQISDQFKPYIICRLPNHVILRCVINAQAVVDIWVQLLFCTWTLFGLLICLLLTGSQTTRTFIGLPCGPRATWCMSCSVTDILVPLLIQTPMQTARNWRATVSFLGCFLCDNFKLCH